MLLFSPGSFRVRKFIVKVYRDWKQMKFSSCWSLCVCMCTGVICTHCMHTHCSLPPSGLREKNKKKGKVWELIGWGKYSLIKRKEGEEKNKKSKWCTTQFLTTSWLMPSQSSSRGSPLQPTSPSFIVQHELCGTGHLFGQPGPGALVVSPLSCLCSPCMLTGRAAWETEKLLALLALLNNN